MKVEYSEILTPVVTAREMSEIDRYAIEKIGVPGVVLMENAGQQVFHAIQKMLGSVQNKDITIFCGKGNNGGDGYVVARYLLAHGANVKTYLIGKASELKGDSQVNFNILNKLGHQVREISRLEHIQDDMGAHLIVDALLGTGVKGELRGFFGDLVSTLGKNNAPILAIDIPTGVESDIGAVGGACIRARMTVTMALPKRGLLFSPGREHCGELVVADIGIPQSAIRTIDVKCFRITESYVRQTLPVRSADTFKNKCGQVLVLAGSVGMTGAAGLSSNAVLRVGAGMVILGIPESLNSILEEKLTEVMTLPLPETDRQSLSSEAKEKLVESLSWANVLALGPGLSAHPKTKELVNWLIKNYDQTIVLDADAINCLQGEDEIFAKRKQSMVLTPHIGEFSRLSGIKKSKILENPVEVVREYAKGHKVVLILKGAPTIIGSPDGVVFINSTGNAGMATAGMGDVLTGAIAGLIAQGMSPLDGAIAGVYLHGLAGDLAKSTFGEKGLIASDVLAKLPFALKGFEN